MIKETYWFFFPISHCSVFDQLCDGTGWDEGAGSGCSILLHDPCESLPASLCGGWSLEWGALRKTVTLKASRFDEVHSFKDRKLNTVNKWTAFKPIYVAKSVVKTQSVMTQCVFVSSGGHPDHHGLDARWFWLHVGVWWSGVGSLHVHSAGLLSCQAPQPPEPPCCCSHRLTQV